MKYGQRHPCAECPFRAKSLAGWLGPDVGKATALIKKIGGYRELPGHPGLFIGGEPMDYACHMSTARVIKQFGTDASGALAKPHAKHVQHCVGALLYLASNFKLPYDKTKAAAMDKVSATETMLAREDEFIQHHSTKRNLKAK